jgi:hypothetical protein
MKYTILDARNEETFGTSLTGYITTTRAELENVFGKPSHESFPSPYEKVTAEWGIKFDNGVVATIYDWKRYELGTPSFNEVYEWHVGGNAPEATSLVKEALSTTQVMS